MSANRVIPFGYAITDGINILHPHEASCVQRIFTMYKEGDSFLGIAMTLAKEGAEFQPGRSDWNKNRIKRILEDSRYLGNKGYPEIIDAESFIKVQTIIKEKRNNPANKAEAPFHLPCPIMCGCGGKMARRCAPNRKASQQVWTCQNPVCKRIVSINDDTLLAGITQLLNQLIAVPNIIGPAKPGLPERPMEIMRRENEVSRLLDAPGGDNAEIRAAILSLAVGKYTHIGSQTTVSHLIRAEFEQQTPLFSFSPELVKCTVAMLMFDDADMPGLVLKNEQHIWREPRHANNDCTPTAESTTADAAIE